MASNNVLSISPPSYVARSAISCGQLFTAQNHRIKTLIIIQAHGHFNLTTTNQAMCLICYQQKDSFLQILYWYCRDNLIQSVTSNKVLE